MKTPGRPWPLPAVLVWMAIFGFVATWLRIGFTAEVALGFIAAVLGVGRPR